MYELAQVNVARLLAPLDSARLADFVALLDPVNDVADRSDGFVWRLQTEDGNATGIGGFEDDIAGGAGILVNMSTWRDVESLAGYVYGPMHRMVLKRRREWFALMKEAYAACWWVPAGHRPTVAEAEAKVALLRAHGPTPEVFTLQRHFPPPTVAPQVETQRDDWMCGV